MLLICFHSKVLLEYLVHQNRTWNKFCWHCLFATRQFEDQTTFFTVRSSLSLVPGLGICTTPTYEYPPPYGFYTFKYFYIFNPWLWLLLPIFLTCGSLTLSPGISIFSPRPTLPSPKRESSVLPFRCNFIIYVSNWITRCLFLKLSPLIFKTVSINYWGILTCIHPANLALSVYCFLAKLFSRKYVVPSNTRKGNISSSVISLVKLPVRKSSISGLCMLFFLLLTIRVHSESSVWIDLWWSVRGHLVNDLFFLCSVCFSFSDISSWFDVFPLFFLMFIPSVFLSG